MADETPQPEPTEESGLPQDTPPPPSDDALTLTPPDSNLINPDELAALVAQAPALDVDVRRKTAPAAAPAPAAAEPTLDANDPIAQAMAEAIAAESAAKPAPAAAAPAAVAPAPSPIAPGPAVVGETTVPVCAEAARTYAAPELSTVESASATNIDMLDDVQLDVKIELGRTSMYIEDVLRLGAGSVVELDKLAGDPVDIYVNERLIARGEVLVLNDNFCVRINAIHSPIPDAENS